MIPYGSFWKQQRKFTLMSLRDFGFGKRSLQGKISEEAEGLTKDILKTDNTPFNARPLLQNAISNVICSIVFGARFGCSDPRFKYLMDKMNQNVDRRQKDLARAANFFPWLRHIPAVRKAVNDLVSNTGDIQDTLRQVVIEHKETFDPSDIRDFIDAYLLEMNQQPDSDGFTEDQLTYVITDLFFTGSETSSITLTWALLYMVLYPEVQQKVQQEIDSVVGQDTVLSLAHRGQLPYTEAVIAEVMRINPIAATGGLIHATSRDTSLFGYDIPEGTMVWPILWSVLHDPTHYPEPEVFKPQRFLDESGQFVKSHTFIPFSTGRRVCLGENLAKMELFLFFTHLLQHFTFNLPEGAAKPSTLGTLGIITNNPVSFELCAIPREVIHASGVN